MKVCRTTSSHASLASTCPPSPANTTTPVRPPSRQTSLRSPRRPPGGDSMSEYGISNGAAGDYVKKDGRTKQEPKEQWDHNILARERLAASIAPSRQGDRGPTFGFRRFDFETTWIARARVLASGSSTTTRLRPRRRLAPGPWGRSGNDHPAGSTHRHDARHDGKPTPTHGRAGFSVLCGLDDDARELLNLPHPSSKPSLMKIENWEQNVGNAFRRFLKTYDPYPTFKEPTTPDAIGAHQLTGTSRRASRSTRRSGTSVTSTASSSAWSASTAHNALP